MVEGMGGPAAGARELVQGDVGPEPGRVVTTPPMVGSTWPRVRFSLESDCLPTLSQGTASFRLIVD